MEARPRSRLGNALVARNGVDAGSSGAATIHGAQIEIVNSTIAANGSAGLSATGGGRVALANVILTANGSANCGPLGAQVAIGSSMQFPGATCGAAMPVADPGLHPTFRSEHSARPARAAKRALVRTPLVRAVDLYGNVRLSSGTCGLGAIEPDRMREWVGELPFGLDPGLRWPWLFWFILILFVLGFIMTNRWRTREEAVGEAIGGPLSAMTSAARPKLPVPVPAAAKGPKLRSPIRTGSTCSVERSPSIWYDA